MHYNAIVYNDGEASPPQTETMKAFALSMQTLITDTYWHLDPSLSTPDLTDACVTIISPCSVPRSAGDGLSTGLMVSIIPSLSSYREDGAGNWEPRPGIRPRVHMLICGIDSEPGNVRVDFIHVASNNVLSGTKLISLSPESSTISRDVMETVALQLFAQLIRFYSANRVSLTENIDLR